MGLESIQRRRFLAALATVPSVAIAGCTGGGGGSGGGGSSGGGSDGGGSGGGSGGGGSSPWVQDVEQQPNPDSIEALNLGSMDGDPAIQGHFDTFEKQNGIAVKPRVVPPVDALSKSRALLQGQSAKPDLYDLSDSAAFDLGARGFFERLDEFIETKDAWVPGAQKAATWPIKGIPEFQDFPYPKGTYMAPHFAEGWIPFINMDVMERAGVGRDVEPQTFGEVLEICDQLSDAVETPILFPFANFNEGLQIFYDLVMRAGGQMFDGTTPTFENEGFVSALDFLLSLVSEGYAPQGVSSLSEGQTTTQFFDGKAGFMMNALGNLFLPGKDLPINKPAAEVARVTTYPTPQNASDTPTGNLIFIGYQISAFSKHKKASAKFANLVTTQERQAAELLEEGNIPLRTDVFDLPEVQEQIPYTGVISDHLGGYDKFFYPNSSEIDQMVYSEITGAMANNRSAKDAARRMQQQAEGM